jgi:hypothetical protein
MAKKKGAKKKAAKGGKKKKASVKAKRKGARKMKMGIFKGDGC